MQETHSFTIKTFKKSKLQDPTTIIQSIISQLDSYNDLPTSSNVVTTIDQRLRSLSLQDFKENIPPAQLAILKCQPEFKHIKKNKRRSSKDAIEGLFDLLEGNTKEVQKSHKKVVLPAQKQNHVQKTLNFKPSIKKTASATKSITKVLHPLEENNVMNCERILH
jgi:hypothetical protein